MTFEHANYLACLCDSYSRFNRIRDLVDQLPEKDWLKLLGKYWTCCDDVGLHADYLLFDSPISKVQGPVWDLMTEKETSFLRDLPSQITVYRGCYLEHNDDGISYSLKKEIAKKFPLMVYDRRSYGYTPVVRTGRVDKENIISYFSSRNEQEIVVRHVEIIDDEYL